MDGQFNSLLVSASSISPPTVINSIPLVSCESTHPPTHTHAHTADVLIFLVSSHNYISLLSAFIHLVMLERSIAFSIWSMCACTKTPEKMYLLEKRSQWLVTWGPFVINTTRCHYCAKHLFTCGMKEI